VGLQVKKSIGGCLIVLLLFGCGGSGGDSEEAENRTPSVSAGADQTVYIIDSEPQTITLSGTSSDSDGTIVSHLWESSDGNASLSGADTSTATFIADATAQTYTFTYTVTDDDGASASDEVSITVINNSAPTVDAGTDQTVLIEDSETQTITLSGTSDYEYATIVSHQWECTNGDVSLIGANTSSATFTVDATNQTYTFTYTVTYDDGASASDEVSVTVINSNPPTVDAGTDQSLSINASQTLTVTLSGTASDSDGTIESYQWEQTEGTTVTLTGANSATATFTAEATAQTYTFRLTVTDNDGVQSSDGVSVVVTLNESPTAEATADDGIDEPITLAASGSQTITLSGTATDSDGTIATHQWEQTDGTTVTLTGADSATAAFTVSGTTDAYTFTYTVTDDGGAQASDTVTVYVTRIMYSDDFANANNWTDIDDTGNGVNWGVVNGQLRQTSYDVGRFGSDTTTYQLGTYALLGASNITSNSYRISVDITPLTNGTGYSQGNDVGIMFRYLDANNYYRVAMNAKFGYTRFEKYSGGSFETLAVNAIGYVEDQQLTMQAEVNGSTIIVWIDDDPIFAVVDDAPITSGTVALYCQDNAQFDNVVITEATLQPTVAIATPLAYSVALTEDDGNSLSVEAVALNMPSGGSVGFTLNNNAEVAVSTADSDGYYTTQYTGVANGNHAITAVLRDAEGQSVASATNDTVGVGGNYYIAIGDSITNGEGDEDDSNNWTERIVANRGYEAPLADLLTDATGRPQIVFNEGIPGDESGDLENRIDSILERHPGANRVLMMIGTNDSDGNAATIAAYQGHISNIATAIVDRGKDLWIAYPLPTYTDSPPTTLDGTRNGNIEDFIVDINTVVAGNSNISVGPDFYDSEFRIDNNLAVAAYFSDNLHPNDAGYGEMATKWNDTLPLP